jgi:iron complex transport system permease protein
MVTASGPQAPPAHAAAMVGAVLLLAGLATASVFIGVGDVSLPALFGDDTSADALRLLVVSRIPRTVAVLLAGMSMGVAAVIMQMLFRNRFVEPTTSGTVEAASLGLVVVALAAPGMVVIGKMSIAACFALASTFLFLRIVARIPAQHSLIVPLVGLMLGGVVQAATVFLAYRFDLMQSLASWTNGDFSGVLRGRYELLAIGGGLAALAYFVADRFTVAGLGEDFAANLGLDYHRIVALGLTIVSMVTAINVATVGAVPFLGLIVANVVSLMIGDNLRRSLPWIALAGAGFLLVCDIAGRLIRFPYEIPVGTVVGIVGSAIFLSMLLTRRARLG